MNNNNLNLFRHFYYVIYYGNFTRASEKLLISQPALSYSLKKLQENLGYSLIEKDTKNIRLKEKGKAIYHALEKSLEI